MEPPLSPPDPTLVGEADLDLWTSPGPIDRIIDEIESSGWQWKSSNMEDGSIQHVFFMDEIYGDDPEMMGDFLNDELRSIKDAGRIEDLDISLRVSRP